MTIYIYVCIFRFPEHTPNSETPGYFAPTSNWSSPCIHSMSVLSALIDKFNLRMGICGPYRRYESKLKVEMRMDVRSCRDSHLPSMGFILSIKTLEKMSA